MQPGVGMSMSQLGRLDSNSQTMTSKGLRGQQKSRKDRTTDKSRVDDRVRDPSRGTYGRRCCSPGSPNIASVRECHLHRRTPEPSAPLVIRLFGSQTVELFSQYEIWVENCRNASGCFSVITDSIQGIPTFVFFSDLSGFIFYMDFNHHIFVAYWLERDFMEYNLILMGCFWQREGALLCSVGAYCLHSARLLPSKSLIIQLSIPDTYKTVNICPKRCAVNTKFGKKRESDQMTMWIKSDQDCVTRGTFATLH